ncbi:MAG: hypothetical protein HW380_3605 [Magnetococcales bacterium]|nr:hypothetical protein [Magnetococcales bacterium]
MSAIADHTLDLSESLWTICEDQGLVTRRTGVGSGSDSFESPRHFRSIFCSPSNCAQLRAALLGKTAKK